MPWRSPVEQSQDFAKAMNGWAEYLDGLTYKAAGKDLLTEMDNLEPGKSLDESAVRRVALKYKLPPDKMNLLFMYLNESGAFQQRQRELKQRAEDEMRMDSFREQEQYKGKPDWYIQESEKKKIETAGDILKLQARPNDKNKTDFDLFYDAMKAKGLTDEQISNKWHKQKVDEQKSVAQVRVEGFGDFRMKDYYDKATNSMITMSASEYNAMDPTERRTRYMPAAQAGQAIKTWNLMSDMKGVSSDTRTALNNLKTPFNATQSAQLAYVLKGVDPRSAWETFKQGAAAKTLTPDQVDYVTSLLQLQENALALRSVLGAGQGSDELRDAIKKTLPGAITANKQYGTMQLDKFDKTLQRLTKYTPSLDYKGNPPKNKKDLKAKYGLE